MIDDFKDTLRSWVGQLRFGNAELVIKADINNPVDVASATEQMQAAMRLLLTHGTAIAPAGTQLAAQPLALPAPVSIQTTALVPIKTSIEYSLSTNNAARKAKTTAEYRRIYAQFEQYLARAGIVSLSQVTRANIGAYKAELGTVHKLSVRTINKHLTPIGTLFRDARDAGHYPPDLPLPTTGYLFKKHALRKAVKHWEPFSAADLGVIFDPPEYLQFAKPHEHWVPALMLHQGLRVGEASQLATRDIRHENGGWVLEVTDLVEGAQVKTNASRRIIPLHPGLIQLGLLDYIADVKRVVGEGLLFPYLRQDSLNGYGDVPGETLNRYLKPRVNHPRKRAHSFRKTANDMLNQGGVPEERRAAFVGHEHDTVNVTVYTNPLSPAALGAVIFPHLVFPLDYTRLRYVVGRFDDMIRAEMRRRQRQLTRKAARQPAAAKSR